MMTLMLLLLLLLVLAGTTGIVTINSKNLNPYAAALLSEHVLLLCCLIVPTEWFSVSCGIEKRLGAY